MKLNHCFGIQMTNTDCIKGPKYCQPSNMARLIILGWLGRLGWLGYVRLGRLIQESLISMVNW